MNVCRKAGTDLTADHGLLIILDYPDLQRFAYNLVTYQTGNFSLQLHKRLLF